MPIQLTQRSRAVLWLLVRLVRFAGVSYVAVESLLLKPSREKWFDGVEDTGLAVWFRVCWGLRWLPVVNRSQMPLPRGGQLIAHRLS